MKNIISTFGGELTEVVIDELRDGTFYAKLNIAARQIDSRPSDAIALAVRYGAQIYVASTVMDEAAFVPEEEEEEQPPASATRPERKQPEARVSRLDQLRQQLREAVEQENYEKAAQLRDEIRKTESRG